MSASTKPNTMTTTDCILEAFVITDILPCITGVEKSRVIAEFPNDISPVFPYLNAIVPKLIFNQGANSITIKREGHLLTFYPRGASLAKVAGVEDAQEQLQWFQTMCNRTWQHRQEITPCYERHKTIDPLDAYQYLPQLNCKECGQATCWAFVWEVLHGDLPLSACTHLSDPAYRDAGRRLEVLLG